MSTTKAPTLFGKRMRTSLIGDWVLGAVRVYPAIYGGGYFANAYGWYSENRKSPQAAANDAERYLRRLHRALGKVVGHEGE